MPTTKITTLYTYNELSDNAKEKARDWYREGGFDYEWWDFSYETIKEIGEILGIEFEEKKEGIPSIFFRLAYSQGDGSSFNARYTYKAGSVRKINREFPNWEGIISIAERLRDVQRKYFYKLRADVKSVGDSWISVDVEHTENYNVEIRGEDEKELIDTLRDFNRWIYCYLRDDYEGLSSDEAVAETIIANGYTFTEDGKRENL